MNYPIPIRANALTGAELAGVLSALPGGAPDGGDSPVMMGDPATAALLVDAATVVVPSLIAAIATVWAAYVTGREKKHAQPAQPIIILIETNHQTITVPIAPGDVAASIAQAELPTDVTEITRIRLEG